MSKYDTVLFDLDGTLLNTLEDLTDSVNYALSKLNCPLRNAEEIRSFVGNGIKRLIKLALPELISEDIEAQSICLELFREYYDKNLYNKTRPYEGIPELLNDLSKRGIKIAVASNKNDQAVKSLCDCFFPYYITVALGAEESRRRKPEPDIVYKALDELNSLKANSLYVGDSDIDVRTAKNAGLISVGVTWGFRSQSVLEAEGADHIISKPAQLIDILAI